MSNSNVRDVFVKYGLICMLACMFSLPAIADDDNWIYIAGDDDTTAYLQNKDVVVDMDKRFVEAWIKFSLPNNGYVLGKNRYDCVNDKRLNLEIHEYNADGTYNSGGNMLESEWLSIIPDSIGVPIIKMACVAGVLQEIDKAKYIGEGSIPDDYFMKIKEVFGSYSTIGFMINAKNTMDSESL